MSLPPIGAQLIIFGGKLDINNDTDVILAGLSSAGYVATEGGARDPQYYRARLEHFGMVHAASHVGLAALESPDRLADYLDVAGGKDICNSGLIKWGNHAADDFRAAASALNRAGAKLAARGVRLHYHNHDFEFHKVDGPLRGIDILLAETDPAVVDLCVDIAWVKKGGDDPAEFLDTHRDRVGYLHFKDFNDNGWCPLGRGKVNFDGVLSVLRTLDRASWVVIEQDTTAGDPMADMAASRAFLRDTYGY
jgi:sugar phosphate isomerase/epimerase